MTTQKTTARKISSQQRRLQAVEMRLAGYNFIQIGEALKISKQAAFALIKRVNEETRQKLSEASDQLRGIQHSRYEKIISRLWPLALPNRLRQETILDLDGSTRMVNVPIDPDMNALDRLMSAMSSENKLLGLQAPDSVILIGIRREAEELAAAIASEAAKYIPEESRIKFLESVGFILEQENKIESPVFDVATE